MAGERRKDKQQELRAGIVEAAITVVGRHGYAKASMARIAEEAGIAYGSIYLHFESQRDLFLHLLPRVGERLRKDIRRRGKGARSFMEHETVGFDVLFDAATRHPGERRVFTEAAFFVPEAYDAYLERMADAYVRTMRACKTGGDLAGVEEADFRAVAFMLMGAKQFLILKYFPHDDAKAAVPESVRSAYLRFVAQAVSPGGAR